MDCGPSVNSLPATALPCCARVIRCTESLFGSLGLVCYLPSVEKAKTPGQAADPPSILVHARRPRTALLSATPPCCTTPLRHIQPWGASHPPTPTPSQDPRTRLFRCRCRCERIFLFTLPLQQQAPCAVAPPRLSASSPVLLNPSPNPAPITGSLSLGSVQPSATGASLPWGVDVVATPQLPQRDLSSRFQDQLGSHRLPPLRPPKQVHGPCFRTLWAPFRLGEILQAARVCVGHPGFPLVAQETRTRRRRHAQPQIRQSRHLQLRASTPRRHHLLTAAAPIG